MNECLFSEEFLERLFSGDVSNDELSAFKAHLDEDCPDCEKFISSLDKESVDALWGFVYTMDRPGTDEEFSGESVQAKAMLKRIENEISKEEQKKERKPNIFDFRRMKALPIAASLILMTSVIYYVFGHNPPGPTTKGPEIILEIGFLLKIIAQQF